MQQKSKKVQQVIQTEWKHKEHCTYNGLNRTKHYIQGGSKQVKQIGITRQQETKLHTNTRQSQNKTGSKAYDNTQEYRTI